MVFKEKGGTTNFGSDFSASVVYVLVVPGCSPVQWWECWSGLEMGDFELRVIIVQVPVKLSGSELWNSGDELTILKEWFQWACESKRPFFITDPCGGLKELFQICDRLGEDNWDLSGSELKVSETRLMPCGIWFIFDTVGIGVGNSDLFVFFGLAKLIGCVKKMWCVRIFYYFRLCYSWWSTCEGCLL